MKKILSVLLCVAAAGVSTVVAKDAPVPGALEANPQAIQLKLENEHVRVLEATLEPGQKENPHSHPAYVVYVLAGGTIRLHGADGKTSDLTFKTGDVLYREPVAQHWGENVGTTTTHLILVELKGDH
jgi:quercetin dioxygenase-like cupin family protein